MKQINPQHTIPTLVDNENNGLALAESRAIMAYLVNKKSPGHKLYPADPAERAQVDRVLYFEAGTLYPAQTAAFFPIFKGGKVDEEKFKVYEEKLAILNSMLDGKKYLGGHNHRTIADLSMIVSLTAAECLPGVDLSKYPNIHAWYKNLRSELPYDEELVQAGIDAIKALIASKAEEK